MNVEKVVTHLAGYIGKYSDNWKELELWRVLQDDYSIDSSEVPYTVIDLHNLTMEKLEAFYEGSIPNQMILFQN